MKTIILVVLCLLSLRAFAASETIPIYGHLVFFHCDPNASPGCSSDPDLVEKSTFQLTGDSHGLLQGSQVFRRSMDGFDFKVTVTGYKMSSGGYFFRADLVYVRQGHGEVAHFRRLGNTFVGQVKQLGQVYWNGENVAAASRPLAVDFGFGYDSDPR